MDLLAGSTVAIATACVANVPAVARVVSAVSGDITPAMRGRSAQRMQTAVTRGVVVACEVAVAVVALSLAGGVVSAMREQAGQDTGYAVGDVSIVTTRFRTPGSMQGAMARVQQSIERIPGVHQVAVADLAPLGGLQFVNDFTLESVGTVRQWAFNRVSTHYFDVVGLALTAGRRPTSDTEVVVNEALARELGGGERALMEVLRTEGPGSGRFRIVGVVADSVYENLIEGQKPIVYHSRSGEWSGSAALLVRPARPEVHQAVLGAVREHGDVGQYEVSTLEARRSQLLRVPRALGGVATCLAVMLAACATASVWSLLAVVVNQHRRAIAIRIALGAQRLRVGLETLTPLLAVLAGGVIAGWVGVAVVSRLDGAGLISPESRLTSWTAVATGSAVALASLWWTVLRTASRVEVYAMLREE